jgi:hypothetical protein
MLSQVGCGHDPILSAFWAMKSVDLPQIMKRFEHNGAIGWSEK